LHNAFALYDKFKLPLLVGFRNSQLDACTSMEHAHLLKQRHGTPNVTHCIKFGAKKIMPKSYTNAYIVSLSSPTYGGRAKNGLMMNFMFQPLLHKASTKAFFWCANWRRRSSQTSNNCRYLFLHTWVEALWLMPQMS
jgi:hypothetical protein